MRVRTATVAAPEVMHRVVDSPVGVITLVGDGTVLSGLYLTEQRHHPGKAGFGPEDELAFPNVVRQLDAYFAGRLTTFDVPLAPVGTPFQQRVWQALLDIGYGTTQSYGAIARRIGQPNAARAVGLANGRNPISIIVPCHRVVGSDGRLVGYGGGIERKQYLLGLEWGERRLDA